MRTQEGERFFPHYPYQKQSEEARWQIGKVEIEFAYTFSKEEAVPLKIFAKPRCQDLKVRTRSLPL